MSAKTNIARILSHLTIGLFFSLALPSLVYAQDVDGDGHDVATDCDDQRADVHPGATEIFGNGIDDDCNAETPDVRPDPGTLTVLPNQDTTIRTVEANMGAVDRLYFSWTQDVSYMPIIQFAPVALPEATAVTEAWLELTFAQFGGAELREICVHRMTNSWAEGTAGWYWDDDRALTGATWQYRDYVDGVGVPWDSTPSGGGGDYEPVPITCVTVESDVVPHLVRFNVSSAVADALHGFVLIPMDVPWRSDQAYSRESVETEHHPRLVVSYDLDPALGLSDEDADGHLSGVDCNDNDASIHPGAVEVHYDGVDNDCDPTTADVIDVDQDGYDDRIDCNDNSPLINPGALERPNGVDDDCDPTTDDVPTPGYVETTSTQDACLIASPIHNVGQAPGAYIASSVASSTSHAILNFGQYTLPQFTVFRDAAVRVNVLSLSNDDEVEVCIHRVQTGWTEGAGTHIWDSGAAASGVNWDTSDGQVSWVREGGDYDLIPLSCQFVSTSNGTVYDFPVGDVVHSSPHGFMLVADPVSATVIEIHTRDVANPSLAPKLRIGYDPDSQYVHLDRDGDGAHHGEDCDDFDDTRSPHFAEVLGDQIDNDCDPNTMDYIDNDLDGYLVGVDCDDSRPEVHPGATEVLLNGLDDDCNPETSDDMLQVGAVRDNSLRPSDEINMGAMSPLYMGMNQGPHDSYRTIIQFEDAPVPANADIMTSTIMLTLTQVGNADPRQFCIYALEEAWVEGEATYFWDYGHALTGSTWLTSDGTQPWTYPGGVSDVEPAMAIDCQQGVWAVGDVLQFDVTGVTEVAEHGFAVVAHDVEWRLDGVHSRESAEIAHRPWLLHQIRRTDADGDGYIAGDAVDADCDDENAEVHPGQHEIPDDGLDNDCNPLTDDRLWIIVRSPGDGDRTVTDRVTLEGSVLPRWGSELSINGLPTVLDDEGNFTAEVPLYRGQNDILLVAFWSAPGHANKLERMSFTVHRGTLPPQLAVTEPSEGAYIGDADRVMLRGTVTPREELPGGNDVSLTVNGAAVPVDQQGAFELEAVLPIQETTLTFVAVDSFGLTHTVERTVSRAEGGGDGSGGAGGADGSGGDDGNGGEGGQGGDAGGGGDQAPAPLSLSVTAPLDGQLLADANLSVLGNVSGGEGPYQLRLNGVLLDAQDGILDETLTVGEGPSALVVEVVDASGRVVREVRSVLVDLTQPMLRVDTPEATDGPLVVHASPYSVTGSAFDTYLEEVTINGQPIELIGGRFQRFVHLNPGAQTIEIIARDRAGNITRITRPVHLDGSPPDVYFLSPSEGDLVDDSPISVRVGVNDADEIAAVSVSLGEGRLTVEAAAQADGTYLANIPVPLGEVTLLAKARDSGNNVGSATITIQHGDIYSTPLEVVGLRPSADQGPAASDSIIGVVFNKPIEGTNLASHIRVSDRQGELIPGEYNLAPDNVMVMFMARGPLPSGQNITIEVDAEIAPRSINDRESAGMTSAWRGQLRVQDKPTALTGIVHSSLNMPIDGARVAIEGTDYVTYTDRYGNWVIDGFEGGNYTVSIGGNVVAGNAYLPIVYRKVHAVSQEVTSLSLVPLTPENTNAVQPVNIDSPLALDYSEFFDGLRIEGPAGSLRHPEGLQSFMLTATWIDPSNVPVPVNKAEPGALWQFSPAGVTLESPLTAISMPNIHNNLPGHWVIVAGYDDEQHELIFSTMGRVSDDGERIQVEAPEAITSLAYLGYSPLSDELSSEAEAVYQEALEQSASLQLNYFLDKSAQTEGFWAAVGALVGISSAHAQEMYQLPLMIHPLIGPVFSYMNRNSSVRFAEYTGIVQLPPEMGRLETTFGGYKNWKIYAEKTGQGDGYDYENFPSNSIRQNDEGVHEATIELTAESSWDTSAIGDSEIRQAWGCTSASIKWTVEGQVPQIVSTSDDEPGEADPDRAGDEQGFAQPQGCNQQTASGQLLESIDIPIDTPVRVELSGSFTSAYFLDGNLTTDSGSENIVLDLIIRRSDEPREADAGIDASDMGIDEQNWELGVQLISHSKEGDGFPDASEYGIDGVEIEAAGMGNIYRTTSDRFGHFWMRVGYWEAAGIPTSAPIGYVPAGSVYQNNRDKSGRNNTRVYNRILAIEGRYEGNGGSLDVQRYTIEADAVLLKGTLTFVDREGKPIEKVRDGDSTAYCINRDHLRGTGADSEYHENGELKYVSAQHLCETEVHFFKADDLTTPIARYSSAKPFIDETEAYSDVEGEANAHAFFSRLRPGPSQSNTQYALMKDFRCYGWDDDLPGTRGMSLWKRCEDAGLDEYQCESLKISACPEYNSILHRQDVRLSHGDELVIFAINHWTGYSGIQRVKVDAGIKDVVEGSSPLHVPVVDGNILLYPPEIEVRVERAVKHNDERHLLRAGGGALEQDKYVTVNTTWGVRQWPEGRLDCDILGWARHPKCKNAEDVDPNQLDAGVDGGSDSEASAQDAATQRDGGPNDLGLGPIRDNSPDDNYGKPLGGSCALLRADASEEKVQECRERLSAVIEVPGGVPPLAGRVISTEGEIEASGQLPSPDGSDVRTLRVAPGRSTLWMMPTLELEDEQVKLENLTYYVHVTGRSIALRDIKDEDDEDGGNGNSLLDEDEMDSVPPFVGGENAAVPENAFVLKNVYRHYVDADVLGVDPHDEQARLREYYDLAQEHQFRVIKVEDIQVSQERESFDDPDEDVVAQEPEQPNELEADEYDVLIELIAPEVEVGRDGSPGVGGYAARLVNSDGHLTAGCEINGKRSEIYQSGEHRLNILCDQELANEWLTAGDLVYLQLFFEGNAENILKRIYLSGYTHRRDYVTAGSQYTVERATEGELGDRAVRSPVSQPGRLIFSISRLQMPQGEVKVCTRTTYEGGLTRCDDEHLLAAADFEFSSEAGRYKLSASTSPEGTPEPPRMRREGVKFLRWQRRWSEQVTEEGAESEPDGMPSEEVFELILPPDIAQTRVERAQDEVRSLYVEYIPKQSAADREESPPRNKPWIQRIQIPVIDFEGMGRDPAQDHVGAVNLATGALSFGQVEFAAPLGQWAFGYNRSYHNLDDEVGPLGRGWRHNFQSYLLQEWVSFKDAQEVAEPCSEEDENETKFVGRYSIHIGHQTFDFPYCTIEEKAGLWVALCGVAHPNTHEYCEGADSCGESRTDGTHDHALRVEYQREPTHEDHSACTYEYTFQRALFTTSNGENYSFVEPSITNRGHAGARFLLDQVAFGELVAFNQEEGLRASHPGKLKLHYRQRGFEREEGESDEALYRRRRTDLVEGVELLNWAGNEHYYGLIFDYGNVPGEDEQLKLEKRTRIQFTRNRIEPLTSVRVCQISCSEDNDGPKKCACTGGPSPFQVHYVHDLDPSSGCEDLSDWVSAPAGSATGRLINVCSMYSAEEYVYQNDWDELSVPVNERLQRTNEIEQVNTFILDAENNHQLVSQVQYERSEQENVYGWVAPWETVETIRSGKEEVEDTGRKLTIGRVDLTREISSAGLPPTVLTLLPYGSTVSSATGQAVSTYDWNHKTENMDTVQDVFLNKMVASSGVTHTFTSQPDRTFRLKSYQRDLPDHKPNTVMDSDVYRVDYADYDQVFGVPLSIEFPAPNGVGKRSISIELDPMVGAYKRLTYDAASGIASLQGVDRVPLASSAARELPEGASALLASTFRYTVMMSMNPDNGAGQSSTQSFQPTTGFVQGSTGRDGVELVYLDPDSRSGMPTHMLINGDEVVELETTYDEKGMLVSSTTVDGDLIRHEYSDSGMLLASSFNDLATEYEYEFNVDVARRVTTRTGRAPMASGIVGNLDSSAGSEITRSYTADGRVSAVNWSYGVGADASGQITGTGQATLAYQYDEGGRLAEVGLRYGGGNWSTSSYAYTDDVINRIEHQLGGNLGHTAIEYGYASLSIDDANAHFVDQVTVTPSAGAATVIDIGHNGLPSQSTTAGITSQSWYTPGGMVRRASGPTGYVDYQWDKEGLLTGVKATPDAVGAAPPAIMASGGLDRTSTPNPFAGQSSGYDRISQSYSESSWDQVTGRPITSVTQFTSMGANGAMSSATEDGCLTCVGVSRSFRHTPDVTTVDQRVLAPGGEEFLSQSEVHYDHHRIDRVVTQGNGGHRQTIRYGYNTRDELIFEEIVGRTCTHYLRDAAGHVLRTCVTDADDCAGLEVATPQTCLYGQSYVSEAGPMGQPLEVHTLRPMGNGAPFVESVTRLDARGRVTSERILQYTVQGVGAPKVVPEREWTYEYSEGSGGQTVVVTPPQGDGGRTASTTTVYDALGRIERQSDGLSTVEYTYGDDHRLSTVTRSVGGTQASQIAYTYVPSDGRIDTITETLLTTNEAYITDFDYPGGAQDALQVVVNTSWSSGEQSGSRRETLQLNSLGQVVKRIVDGGVSGDDDASTPALLTESAVYDGAGRLHEMTTTGQAPVRYTYDATGTLSRVSRGDLFTTDYHYIDGQVSHISDRAGTQYFEYFGNGQVEYTWYERENDESPAHSVRYGLHGQAELVEQPGEAMTYVYGPLGNVYFIEYTDGRVVVRDYYNSGQLKSVELTGVLSDAAFLPKRELIYQPDGRLSTDTIVGRGNSRRTTNYASQGLITTVTTPEGHTIRHTADGRGRVRESLFQNAAAGVVRQTVDYNGDNQPISIVEDFGGGHFNTTTMNHDALGRMTQHVFSAHDARFSSQIDYEHGCNAQGCSMAEVMESASSLGTRRIERDFDLYGRLRTLTDTTQFEFQWDDLANQPGRLKSISGGLLKQDFSYAHGSMPQSPTSIKWSAGAFPLGQVDYAYNNERQMVSETYAYSALRGLDEGPFETHYSYDDRRRLSEVLYQPENRLHTYTLAPDGTRTAERVSYGQLGLNSEYTFEHNNFAEVTGMNATHTASCDCVGDLCFQMDDGCVDPSATPCWGHCSDGSACNMDSDQCADGSFCETYAQNCDPKVVCDGVRSCRACRGDDCCPGGQCGVFLSDDVPLKSYEWDDGGRLELEGPVAQLEDGTDLGFNPQSAQYAWSAQDRLITHGWSDGQTDKVDHYTYNASGLRVGAEPRVPGAVGSRDHSRPLQSYMWSRSQVVRHTVGEGVSRETVDYTQAMGRTLKMGEHELAHDVRGTPVFSMDSGSATPVFRLRDVWGMPRGPQRDFADGHSYSVGYTNHMEDESGLTYMQARYYRPELGGFLSRDPIYHAGQGAGVYVDGNPSMMIDPDGRQDYAHYELIGPMARRQREETQKYHRFVRYANEAADSIPNADPGALDTLRMSIEDVSFSEFRAFSDYDDSELQFAAAIFSAARYDSALGWWNEYRNDCDKEGDYAHYFQCARRLYSKSRSRWAAQHVGDSVHGVFTGATAVTGGGVGVAGRRLIAGFLNHKYTVAAFAAMSGYSIGKAVSTGEYSWWLAFDALDVAVASVPALNMLKGVVKSAHEIALVARMTSSVSSRSHLIQNIHQLVRARRAQVASKGAAVAGDASVGAMDIYHQVNRAVGATAEDFARIQRATAGVADDVSAAIARTQASFHLTILENPPLGMAGRSSLWKEIPPGVRIRKIGNWWVKEVNPNSNIFMRWYGGLTLKAQYRALQKLGDLAPGHAYRNGRMFTRDVGDAMTSFRDPGFFHAWWHGSRRIGFLNDIRPRNVGKNGLIFDPALDPLTKVIYLGGAGAAVALPIIYREELRNWWWQITTGDE